MLSVALAAEELAPRIERWGERIELAADNGPSSTIVSGDREAARRAARPAASRKACAPARSRSTVASHSAHVEPLREEVLEALRADRAARRARSPSTRRSPAACSTPSELDAEYWYRNLRQPVRFEPVTRELLDQGRRTFVEVSPHPVFALAVQRDDRGRLDDPAQAVVIGTLRRDEGGPERFLLSLAEAQVSGTALDWEALFAGSGAKPVDLPTYAFQRQRFWLDASTRRRRPRRRRPG